MEAKNLEIYNFMGIGEGHLAFSGAGLTMVIGINHDSPTSVSNGASKSTIYEAIHWALWGTTKRGVKGADVINVYTKLDCAVLFYFDNYCVERRITAKGAKASLNLRVVREDGSFEDISKGTMQDTQDAIEQILGMSESTFDRVSHFGQGDVKPFARLTDSELKKCFEEALGVTFFTQDLEKVKLVAKGVEDSLFRLKLMVESAENDVERKAEMIGKYREMSEAFERDKESQVLAMEQSIPQIEESIRIAQAQADLAEAEVLKIDAKIAEAQAAVNHASDAPRLARIAVEMVKTDVLKSVEYVEAMAAHGTAGDEIKRLEGLDRDLNTSITKERSGAQVLKADSQRFQRLIIENEKKIADATRLIGSACHACGKTIHDTDLSAVIDGLQKAVDDAKASMAVAETGIVDRERALQGLLDLTQPLRDQITAQRDIQQTATKTMAALVAGDHPANAALREAEAQYNTLIIELTAITNSRHAAMTQVNSTSSHVQYLQRQLETTRANIESARVKPNSFVVSIVDAENAYLEAKEALVRTKADLEEARVELDTLEMLKEILGNGGAKSLLFDAVTPELNRLIAEQISVLDDIDIEVSTVKRLKSGETREKFSIEVANRHGAQVFAGNSGGEQQKVNIAISLAFNAVVRSMCTQSLNFLFLDEVFESLDEGSSEPVIELCRRITADIPNVFLISHQSDLKSLVESRLEVVKKNNVAKFDFCC